MTVARGLSGVLRRAAVRVAPLRPPRRSADHELRQHPRHHRPHAGRPAAPHRAEARRRCTPRSNRSIPAARSRIVSRSRSSSTPKRKGLLKPGDTVVEATSGNTGVALAMVCAARGYKFVATMADTFSIERRKLMRAYGAKVILTPAAERGSGMVRRAEELAKQHGWFLARQFTESRPTPPITARRPPRKSCATSPAIASIISSPAGAPAARSPASAKCCAWRGRK